MLALMAAMARETSPMRAGMSVAREVAEPGCRILEGNYRGRGILLVQTGVGRRRAQRAARLALDRYPVGAAVSFGFAGALNGSVRYGDVVVCDALYCGDKQTASSGLAPNDCLLPDDFLAELAARLPPTGGFNVLRTRGVSVSRVVCEAGDKEALGRAFSAGAVDMESFWIAEIARDWNVPFLAVRAISDAADETLPPFNRFMDANGWSWSKALPFFAGHPQQLYRLWRLRSRMRLPARNMTTVLDWLVDNVRV